MLAETDIELIPGNVVRGEEPDVAKAASAPAGSSIGKTVLDHNILLLDIAGFVQIPGCPRKGTSDLRVNEYAAYSRRQLLANADIAASRVGW